MAGHRPGLASQTGGVTRALEEAWGVGAAFLQAGSWQT